MALLMAGAGRMPPPPQPCHWVLTGSWFFAVTACVSMRSYLTRLALFTQFAIWRAKLQLDGIKITKMGMGLEPAGPR